MPRPLPAAWRTAIEQFVTGCRAAGAPPTTIATRVAHLRRVGRQLGGSPWHVTGRTLVEWTAAQDWATETRRSMRSTLRRFYSWAVEAGHITDSPAEALPPVRAAEPIPRPVPELVYYDALARADERVRLMLRLAAEAGLRRAEVAQVHRRDILDDLMGRSLIVHGKGGKTRTVPLAASLGAAVAQRAAGRGYLFPGDDDGHLSPRYVGKLVSGALHGDWTMHALRHRFATRAYGVSHDTFSVQALLGHASPATTRRYVALPDEGLRRVVDGIA